MGKMTKKEIALNARRFRKMDVVDVRITLPNGKRETWRGVIIRPGNNIDGTQFWVIHYVDKPDPAYKRTGHFDDCAASSDITPVGISLAPIWNKIKRLPVEKK